MTLVQQTASSLWPAEVELVAAPGASGRILSVLAMPAIIDLRDDDAVRLLVTVRDQAEFEALRSRLPDVTVSLVSARHS